MRLYRQTIEDFSLYTGRNLEENEKEALYTAAGAMSAKMRAIRIVSASNVSKRELQHRLIQKGEDPEQAKQAVAWMEEMSVLDDRKTADQIVRSCASKGYGINRARQVLYEKRVPKDIWEEALQDYPDQSAYILSFLKSRLTADSDIRTRQKATNALIRRGHNYSDIRTALQALGEDADDFREDF